MITREQCEGCHIRTGGEEEHELLDYREHRICYWCLAHWEKREARERREISWQEFTQSKVGGL